jgi:signal-transduction protein with cAMP-binding, CBS, and nucleotidyltransferase domain
MSTSDVLRNVWLFSGLTDEQLDAISSFTFQKTFEPGEMIVEEGHTGNGLYMIMSGQVEVVKGLGTENARVPGQARTGRRVW